MSSKEGSESFACQTQQLDKDCRPQITCDMSGRCTNPHTYMMPQTHRKPHPPTHPTVRQTHMFTRASPPRLHPRPCRRWCARARGGAGGWGGKHGGPPAPSPRPTTWGAAVRGPGPGSTWVPVKPQLRSAQALAKLEQLLTVQRLQTGVRVRVLVVLGEQHERHPRVHVHVEPGRDPGLGRQEPVRKVRQGLGADGRGGPAPRGGREGARAGPEGAAAGAATVPGLGQPDFAEVRALRGRVDEHLFPGHPVGVAAAGGGGLDRERRVHGAPPWPQQLRRRWQSGGG